MSLARALIRLTPVFFECSNSLKPFYLVSASYSVKAQHRRPVKIYANDGVTEIQNSPPPHVSRNKNKSPADDIKGVIELQKNNFNRKTTMENNIQDTREDDNESGDISGTHYVRLGDSDSTFERFVAKTQSKKQREKSNMIMLEGMRLIQDAITAGVLPDSIFFSQKQFIEELSMPPGVIQLFKLPYNKIKKWSPLETPPGIIAFCKIPKNVKKSNKSNPDILPLTLICDNVREPGNLGTILRTFSGVGCSDILLTKGCTDIWDTKVLRGAAGAHFHVPITHGLTWEEINSKIAEHARVFIAHHHEKTSETMQEQALMTIPYYSVDYSCLSDIVVIIGGETEGISDDAVQFARYRDGLKINIPLGNNIDSLNVGAAVSAILFEIKRQFIMKKSFHIKDEFNSSDDKILDVNQ